ncbi:hybrid sensor histidine kinase/response regulator [Flavicella sediminum]|uniref:hybrid sensor histidine kinase/response regulator n=1 Tax=Flavicella sediminum TaxID=2585141 RepID=UPI0014072BE5|nr:hybrid sensor histidine kinase/response regulator transcription factor [Flavicella sediminum]
MAIAQKNYIAPSNLSFKNFTTKDGLTQSSIVSITQDSKGYLWFGTRDGLNKFDGTRFINYRHNSEDSTSISHSWVTCIFEDNDKNIWIGTKNGLNLFKPEQNNFLQIKTNSNGISVSDNQIWDITQTNKNRIYVSSKKGITDINYKKNISTYIKNDSTNLNSPSHNNTRCFLNTNDGYLWICTIEKIDRVHLATNTWEHYEYPKNTNKAAHISNTPVLFQDSRGTIWLGYENGIAFLPAHTTQFEDFLFKNEKKIKTGVRSIAEDSNHNLWIGTYSGLQILNTKHQIFKKFTHNENNPKSLSQNSIYKIIKDSKGDMWIGTWAGGINYFDHSYDNFKQISSGASPNMLNYKVVSSILETKENNFWIGTEGGGLNYFNKKTEQFTYYTHDPKDAKSISSNNIKSMVLDQNENLWIGTHDGGLNFLNTKKKPYVFEKLNKKQANGIELKNYRIISLLEDIDHNIWIGTENNGAITYNTSTKEFTRLESEIKFHNCLQQANNPEIIFTGGSGGLSKVNIRTKKTEDLHIIKSKGYKPRINCVFEENDNTIWTGTEGQGLFEFNPKTKESKKYGIAEGLLNEVIYAILPDDDNNIWVSTNNGISRLNLLTKKIKNFDESDGLQGNEFNYGAAHKNDNGILMFGGTNGLNYFNPRSIIENTFVPKVNISAIKVNNKPYLNSIDNIQEIKLKHDQNDFSINFTALSYSQANKNQYAYQLVGFDKNWNYVENKKEANYTNLDEGTYLFKVKASNSDGLWNEKGKSISIIILPAPWKTWWAYSIYIFVCLLISYFIRSFALTRIKEKNELKQEKLDKEKLEEVNQMKLKLFTNISHDFRTPLTLIIGPLQRMMKEKKGNSFIQSQHQIMNRNANMLLDLINQILDFRKSESGKLVLYASKSDLISFIKSVKTAFNDLANHKNVEYIFESNFESLDVWFDKIKMKKIIFNLLSNAFKYNQDNSKISLKITNSKASFVTIEVVNFGEVIPKETLNYVFDRFYRFDQEGIQAGTGIGLALTKSLVELHKGEISVTSSIEKGTCFKVSIPLGDEHLDEDQKITENQEFKEEIDSTQPFYLEKDISIADTKETELQEKENHTPTLLIVEDNEDVRNFIKGIFTKKYLVLEAENGKIAVDIAHKKQVDLIISDVMMPEMNGFELCEHIKTNITTSHIPVILLTAKTAEAHQKTGYTIGADAYITKPFDDAILEIRVDNLLKTRKSLISKFKKDIILEPKELTFTSADEQFLEQAIKIIEENISDPEFNVNYFTNKMNMSRSVLYRKLKAITDQSITEFIRTIKLKKAGQLIAQTQMNISEIAYEVGFNDLKYFRKCFKTLFKVLPSDYRIQNSQTKDDSEKE